MKPAILTSAAILGGLIFWQQLRIADAESKFSDAVATETSKPTNDTKRPPVNLLGPQASAAEHLIFLRELNAGRDPVRRTANAAEWASSLKTPEALTAALAALLDPAIPERERCEIAGRYGPALFAQWGAIDPIGGLLAWSKLPQRVCLSLQGEDHSQHGMLYVGDTDPTHLLEGWAAHGFQKWPEIRAMLLKDDAQAVEDKPQQIGIYTNGIFEQMIGARPVEVLRLIDQHRLGGVQFFFSADKTVLADMAKGLVRDLGSYDAGMKEFARFRGDYGRQTGEMVLMGLKASEPGATQQQREEAFQLFSKMDSAWRVRTFIDHLDTSQVPPDYQRRVYEQAIRIIENDNSSNFSTLLDNCRKRLAELK